jgi:hypothetical protein
MGFVAGSSSRKEPDLPKARNQSFEFSIRAIDALRWPRDWMQMLLADIRNAAERAGVDPSTVVIYTIQEDFGREFKFLVEYTAQAEVPNLLSAAREAVDA